MLVHVHELGNRAEARPIGLGMLDDERLDVYQRAIEHLGFVFRSIPSLPRGYSALVDQWRRAAMSVPLDIAEAVGKTSEADLPMIVDEHEHVTRARVRPPGTC